MSFFKKLFKSKEEPLGERALRQRGSMTAVDTLRSPTKAHRKLSLSCVDPAARDKVKIITVTDGVVHPDCIKAFTVYSIVVETAMGFSHVVFRTQREIKRLTTQLAEDYPQLKRVLPTMKQQTEEGNQCTQYQAFLQAASLTCGSSCQILCKFLDFFEDDETVTRSSSVTRPSLDPGSQRGLIRTSTELMRPHSSLVALNGLARTSRMESDVNLFSDSEDDDEEEDYIISGNIDFQSPTSASGRPMTPSQRMRPLLLAVKSMAKMRNAIKIPHTPQDFEPLCKIGQGGFAKVFLCRMKSSGEVVACKKMAKSKISGKNQIALVEQERHLLVLGSTSPWLVSFHSFFQTDSHLYLAMEFCPGGDLRALLRNVGCLSTDDARVYLAEIMCAVRDLHRFGYIHRDLKPENLLVSRDGHMKLSDFGLSRDSVKPKNDKVEGTPYYMAPEIIRGEDYTISVDYWSMACLLYEMVAGYPAFRGKTPQAVHNSVLNHRNVLKNRPTDASVNAYINNTLADDGSNVVGGQPVIDDVTWDLITKLLTEQDRLSDFKAIRDHPFFDSIDWMSLRSQIPPFVPDLDSATDTGYFNVEVGDVNKEEWFE